MWKDPIVEEIRDAGAKLAEECGYDPHVFADMLRKHQKEAGWPIVSIDYLERVKMRRAKI